MGFYSNFQKYLCTTFWIWTPILEQCHKSPNFEGSVKKPLEIRSDTKNGTFAHCATLQKPVHYTIDVRFLFDLHTEWKIRFSPVFLRSIFSSLLGLNPRSRMLKDFIICCHVTTKNLFHTWLMIRQKQRTQFWEKTRLPPTIHEVMFSRPIIGYSRLA